MQASRRHLPPASAFSPSDGFREPDPAQAASTVGDKDRLLHRRIHLRRDTLTLSAPDRHLNVFLCINVDGNTLSATSSVVTRNLFGRVYMLPVAPAHKLITAYTLRQVRKALESEPNLPMDAAPGPG